MSWPTATLGELGQVNTGSTPKTSDASLWNGNVPFVTPSELGFSVPIISTKRYLSDKGAKISRVASADAVLVCCIGSLGKAGIAGRAVVPNQQINWIEFHQSLIWPRYGYYACNRLERQLEASAASTTLPIVNKSKFSELTIPVPPLDEQRRIATILGKAEALHRKRKRARGLLAEASNSFIELAISQVAKGAVQSLGECLEFMTTGGRNWSQYYATAGSRFIRSLDVQMNGISDEEIVFVDAPDSAEARRTRTRAGDVLLTVTGSRIGRVAALPEELSGSYVSQHVAILRPRSDHLRPRFLSYFLCSQNGQQQIAKWQYGQTKPGLNFKQIAGFEIPKLKVEQQISIENTVARIDDSAQMHRLQETHLDHLLSSLQSRAFSGQL